MSAREQHLQQAYSELAREVPIAGPCVLQRPKRVAQPLLRAAGALGHQRQGLERVRHFGVAQPEIAVASAHVHRYESLLGEQREVLACGRCVDIHRPGDLARGKGGAVEENAQHARAGRVADRGGDPGETWPDHCCIHAPIVALASRNRFGKGRNITIVAHASLACMDTTKAIARPLQARPALVLLATSLGVLIAQIDTSVVTLAVRRIGADLGSTVSDMQWMIDSYNLVYAALLLTGGALGYLYGRRRIFVAGIVLFAIGSIACALAPNSATLLAGRVITGVGAALQLPMSLVLLTLAYPEQRARQRALGVWASCNGLAFVIGPTIGGLLVETAGWRSIFYLILPLCAATLLLVWTSVDESAHPQGRRLDLPGQAAAIVTLSGLAFACIEGTRLGWGSAPVLAAAALSCAGAAAFVLTERRKQGGLVPFELFRSAPFSAALAIAGLMTFGMYALLFLMPLHFQTLRGEGPLAAGIHMLPLSVTFVIVSQLNGPIVQSIGLRATMASGMAAMGVGALLCAFVAAHPGYWPVAAALCIVGVGLGLNTAPVNSVAVANVPRERAGTASGLLNTSRMVGATLGIAILGAVFAHFAGQAADAEGFLPGLRAALSLGAAAELAGAAIALCFIRPV